MPLEGTIGEPELTASIAFVHGSATWLQRVDDTATRDLRASALCNNASQPLAEEMIH